MKTNTPQLPSWLTQEEFATAKKAFPELGIVSVEHINKPGKSLGVLVHAPLDTDWATAMMKLSNIKENTNNPIGAQEFLADRCIVKLEPELEELMKVETVAARYKQTIGKGIGDIFPMPEVDVKKSYKLT